MPRFVPLHVLFAACFLIASCGRPVPDNPKEVVIALFGAMERNDRAAIAHLLDLGALMKKTTEDYALQSDAPRKFTSPEELMNDLVDSGLTKTRWFAMQRVVNNTELISSDLANVEVTFVDKESSKGYLTKFGVHKVNDRWKIFSFNNVPDYD